MNFSPLKKEFNATPTIKPLVDITWIIHTFTKCYHQIADALNHNNYELQIPHDDKWLESDGKVNKMITAATRLIKYPGQIHD